MAELLQRSWSLPVLKVSLEASSAEPQVRFRLTTHADGEPTVHDEWALTVAELLSGSTGKGRGPELILPQAFVDRIATWVGTVLGPEVELWLHLVKPYAFLGALDWEAQLQPALRVPLLRLPDVFPIPEVHRSHIDVAVCASGPAVKGPPPALSTLPLLARALSDPSRSVRLHVFVDEQARGILADRIALPGLEVQLHDPREEAESIAEVWPGISNPWLRWMLSALGGQAIDVVHLIGHGYFTSDQGWLALADSPVGDRTSASHVGATELATFLTLMGAAIAGFSNPPDNYSPTGLRSLVDDLGASRAGPVLLHSPALDPEGAQLMGAYGFLLGDPGRRPPLNPGLLFFCQPSRITGPPMRGIEPIEPETPIDDLGVTGIVRDYFSGSSETQQPKWVAVTERFFDQNRAQLLRERTAGEPSAGELLRPYSEGIEEALRDIRGIVERHADPTVSTNPTGPK